MAKNKNNPYGYKVCYREEGTKKIRAALYDLYIQAGGKRKGGIYTLSTARP